VWSGGGGSEVLWGGRVVCGCKVGCEVLSEYVVDSSEGEHKHCHRRRAPVVRGGRPPLLVVACTKIFRTSVTVYLL